MNFEIGNPLSIEIIQQIITNNWTLSLSAEAHSKIDKCYKYLQNKISSEDAVIYGVNTGFGSLCNTIVPSEQLQELQYNLLRSHACGTGEFVPKQIVKLMLLLKAQSLSYGYSGVQVETVEQIIKFYNQDILPVIYTQGSLGASGDLAPLAHLSLPLVGEGFVWNNDTITPTDEVLKIKNIKPIILQAKEGLALINGTQFMSAYAVNSLIETKFIIEKNIRIASISIDAFMARKEPFMPLTHNIRKQNGQQYIAAQILQLLEQSEISKSAKTWVQDPYSFRCIPQVMGATYDTYCYAKTIIENEINAVTDNPNVFADDDLVISAGNFHGQPLALVLDFLAIAIAELANISERRIFQLISGTRNLTPFLAQNPGLESGFMIPQYTAASIVSQNKQLCTPASIDSIVSSNGQEDHVSMGANAATKLFKIIENTWQVIGIELMVANRGIIQRRPLKIATELENWLLQFNELIGDDGKDKIFSTTMIKAKKFIQEN